MEHKGYLTVEQVAKDLGLTEHRSASLLEKSKFELLKLAGGGLSLGIWRSLSGRGRISRKNFCYGAAYNSYNKRIDIIFYNHFFLY